LVADYEGSPLEKLTDHILRWDRDILRSRIFKMIGHEDSLPLGIAAEAVSGLKEFLGYRQRHLRWLSMEPSGRRQTPFFHFILNQPQCSLLIKAKIRTAECPFSNLPNSKKGHWGEGITAAEMGDYVWLEPRVVAEVKFTEWTSGGVLRHPQFVGIRDDKVPEEVRREL
jgi:hypothetical protein